MTQHIKHCVGKARYRSSPTAAKVARRRESAGAPPLRHYHCHLCQGWHLTKQCAEIAENEAWAIGDKCWILDTWGMAWRGSITDLIGKRKGIMEVTWDTPSGEHVERFLSGSGVGQSRGTRGLTPHRRRPDGSIILEDYVNWRSES